MNRYRRTREIAGLTLSQANRLLGFDLVRLSAIELGDELPTEDAQRRMCNVYGCSIEWLRGDNIEPPEDLVKALRDKDVSSHDRDVVLEFAAMIKDMPPKGTARERIAAAAARNTPEVDPEAESYYATSSQAPRAAKAAYVKRQKQTRNHHCHWPGCTAQVPPAMWGCLAHWRRLPKALRDRIWATYAPGQEVDMTPSEAYLRAADDVQRWIREQQPTERGR